MKITKVGIYKNGILERLGVNYNLVDKSLRTLVTLVVS